MNKKEKNRTQKYVFLIAFYFLMNFLENLIPFSI